MRSTVEDCETDAQWDDRGEVGMGKVLTIGLEVAAGLALAFFAVKIVDPYRGERREARRKAAELRGRLGRAVRLNEYEQLIAANVVNPKRLPIAMSDVYGLEEQIEELRFQVIAPLKDPQFYSTTLWKQTRGVLLYGPPGTGKTMVAKALAQSSGCFFLNVTASSILSKWYGDANRLVRAIFTLAWKLEPCIIFIDEVDALLSSRGTATEHEATLSAKTEFMALWEGMETQTRCRVLVMGATNRREALDPAVLRRFSVQCAFPRPGIAQRHSIIRGYLSKHDSEIKAKARRSKGVDPGAVGVEGALMDGSEDGVPALEWLAKRTEGYSGSDLYELCVQASMVALREHHRSQGPSKGQGQGRVMRPPELKEMHVRPVALQDFKHVLKAFRRPSACDTEFDSFKTIPLWH
eukprot:evm.model.scf_427.2 EVM.evm.TU.scf_427.2   scf_427:21425-24896(-)